MSSSLELRDLQCARGERMLFQPASACVEAGTILRVAGANGVGKTSLLRTICGLSPVAGGQILWSGRSIGAWPRDDFATQAVYLGHAPALKDDLSAIENVESFGAWAGYHASKAECLDALAQVGLPGAERLLARVLSQGQRKRVALARLCLTSQARLWILDEPFNALDDGASHWLQERIHGHLKGGGVAVMTSHHSRAWDVAPNEVSIELSPLHPSRPSAGVRPVEAARP